MIFFHIPFPKLHTSASPVAYASEIYETNDLCCSLSILVTLVQTTSQITVS